MEVRSCNHDGIRGDADGNGTINIGDAVWLNDYIFIGGDPPPCMEEGDVDGSGTINVGDPTYLIYYLYFGGPPPADCP